MLATVSPLQGLWSPDGFTAALGQLLTAEGQLDGKSLERGQRLADESGTRLDIVLTQLGLISERLLAEATAKLLGLKIAAASDYPKTALLPDRLRLKFLRKSRAIPIAVDDRTITVAMADPLDSFAVSAIGIAAARHVEIRVAFPIDLEAALDRLYREEESPGYAEMDELVSAAGAANDDDAERLKDLANDAPLIRLVNQLISHAVETRASDIHIDPFEDRLRVRYRYDGVLHEMESPPRRLQAAVVSRIKIMAMLDIAERRLPQDGRIKLVVRGHEIDLRVSTIPSLHGESVVLRILDRSAVNLDFVQLGMDEEVRKHFCRLLELPNGIILVTGPTGSGKTTTLYTGLLHLNSCDRNIITVEDPIEYQLPGITQIQVKPQIGLNFASLLRTILRHDPDIIMIGEIRDLETAQIAVQAALTGHLVLSTLHTNSAAATIARLRDMGLEDYLLTATLNGIMAQRLVRRLCRDCKRAVPASPELIARFDLERFCGAGPLVLYEPGGCLSCRNTGYTGRLAIAELLAPDETTHRLILGRAGHAEIHNAACASGMRSMYENGLRQVIAGTTSLSEILRSIRLEG
ncbi:MAG TPA: ATPase, T2SS/T4P/T4SS family [Micropepsaceae bacterium]|jgi:general secretion pathway protein E|nr:ATPase, T2SS/T4P/T4SS family [Micropepsaceae bacterium]